LDMELHALAFSSWIAN